MLTIRLSKQAKRFMQSIPLKHAKQILAKIDQLTENPDAVPSVQRAHPVVGGAPEKAPLTLGEGLG